MKNEKCLKSIIIEKFEDECLIKKEDVVIDESRITICINGTKAISLMCIPKEQDVFAIGFLISENIIETINDIHSIEVSEDGLHVTIQAKINECSLENLHKEKTLLSGCGGGVTGNVTTNLESSSNRISMSVAPKTIFAEIKKFYDNSELYLLTGCVHQAMIFLPNETKITAEDIGLHNAVDKVLGKCQQIALDTSISVLFLSGRLSSEMVVKAVMHKIPVVVSRTAPTSLGVQIADTYGVTLIGFARGQKMNIYTHAERIDRNNLKNI